jgi:hypothetical protein
MHFPKIRFSAVLFSTALAAAVVAGQQSNQSNSSQTAAGHIACWKQVNVSPAVMKQRHAIMEAARTKVQGVCKDESLNDQQKKEQIHQIRQDANQQAASLLSAEQNEALKKCQAAQNGGKKPQGHGGNPCGEPAPSEEPSSSNQN